MNSKKNLKRNLLICLLAGSAVMYTLPLHAATSVVANNALPTLPMVNGQIKDGYGFVTGGNNTNIVTDGLQMNITQNDSNAAIKWGSFDVGGSATVNFDYTGKSDFNTLNYVNSASASQIYGTINAQHEGYNGNIFVINPAGVQIGPSAQINVGSLYVSNKYLNESEFDDFNGSNINSLIDTTKTANAELMSLGNINAANNVTFDGNRIVLDTDRVIITNHQNGKLNIKTTDTNNVVLGYEAYDENNGYTDTVDNEKSFNVTKVTIENGTIKEENANVKGYMWVEDVEQLQAINTNLGGNYALRNSIDATSTEQNGFISIGSVNDAFKGKFDGIDYNIFGLTIKNGGENTGLFGYTNNATISNVTLVGGSITGSNNVGAIVGNANNTTLTNVVNSAAVSGDSNVGGIVGRATNTTVEDAINTGTIEGNSKNETNVGGLIGEMKDSNTADNYKSQIIGNSYNLGDVSGNGHNVGGLVGSASNSTIGDGTNLVYNRMDVTGAYNVGGIVGNMEGSIVKYAENSGTVMATGHSTEYYKYHTGETVKDNLPNDADLSSGIASVKVDVANVGGIAGTSSNNSNIQNVTNSGDVSSSKVERQDYYAAGNVGGVVGKAVDTNIDTATNKENSVRGAHNVGGIAGYFGSSKGDETGENVPRYTVTSGINDGGDIMATGARNVNGFVKEQVRPQNGSNEEFIIGNIGGIVGYMDGNNVYVTGSANRGTVHTSEPADPKNVKDWEKAANVGGIVGKIDRSDTKNKNELGKNYENAAVANSYNTGDVLGYTGVGGVVGMMYNGEVAGSYNLGYLRTTRQSTIGGSIDSLNMGGIVGDTTEGSGSVVLYDVYNKGQIGDSEFNYFGRHVGGIVGRLSGTVEKAYNTGAIYNGYNVVGGIAGWMPNGSIENSFNTGNITVVNNNDATSQVGGIVGAASANKDITINNVYNLGTLRSFKPNNNSGDNAIGGIVGGVNGKGGTVSITNAYTTGNIYAALTSLIGGSNKYYYDRTFSSSDNLHIGSIYSENRDGATIEVKNTYYIKPALDENNKPLFTELTGDRNNANKAIDFTDKDNSKNYEFDGGITSPDKTKGSVDENSAWRIYDDNTPILNAFLPNTEKYFGNTTQNPDAMNNITSIQYGTAYDPLLTIINAKDNLIFDWDKLDIGGAGSLVVYGGGLTLDNVSTSNATGGSSYYGGVLYSDGALTIKGNENENLGFGSASELYGSEVTIEADGTVTIYGDVTATGNAKDDDTTGNVTISAGDVNVYGTLTSATAGKDVSISGIANKGNGELTFNDVNNPYSVMPHVGDRFNINITAKDKIDGDITITAGQNDNGNGNVNLYFGNKEEGLITSGGDLNVTGTGNVFVNSDLDIEGNMTLTSTGKDGEVLLTLTNIGKVQANRFTEVIEKAINGIEVIAANENKLINAINLAVGKEFPDLGFSDDPKKAEAIVRTLLRGNNKVEAIDTLNNDVAIEYMHDFMHSFERSYNQDTPGITLYSASGNSKLTVDMWEDNDNGTGQFNFEKYDSNSIYTSDEHTFVEELNNLNLTINDNSNIDAADVVYVEVRNGEQLKGIQDYVDSNVENASDALKFNYALMGDINASDVENYVAIGTGSEFTGTFDGRGNRIIGLDTTKSSTGNGNTLTNAGIFSTIGEGGTVKNVNIYSGNFEGTNTAGSVAGMNSGRIENVTGFGNTVTVTGASGNAGGIVGVNNGKSDFAASDSGASTLTGNGIYDVQNVGSVIAGGNKVVAGGLVGLNAGALGNSYSDSAVTVKPGVTLDKDTTALGGVVGVNTENGDVRYVDSLGITNGGTNSSNVGGIIGVNKGNMYSGYNESIVSGKDKVGGIIGENSTGGTVTNIVNATSVTGENESADNVSQYVGGLVGSNSGSVTNGRNNGTITGTNYVGGMVGSNADEHSILANLTNDSSAAIEGENYVGGIAGANLGTITAQNQSNLINRGSITGQNYVGGVAGENIGTIEYVKNDVNLYVKDSNETAKYFGGVAGINGRVDGTKGTITSATNEGDVVAENAQYVGGIVGWNTVNGVLDGMGNSNTGRVEGETYVGGVAGKNDADIAGTADNIITIENTGVVIAHNGGAGGIFGENTGKIGYAELTNNGIVSGTYNADKVAGTGGIIGVNSGDIKHSSLKNNIGGQVIGAQNVGGLIGVNTGNIEGGRNEQEVDKDGKETVAADSYYKYQIYNNGTITANGNGSNIGGLFGTNSGKVEAAYNTGTINASGSTNVGGIVGNNAGTVDQVFNTVMTENGTGAISGGNNVGGLVGTNSGTLSNAYNTTEVTSTNSGVVGNAVGENSGTITNIYASNIIGNLIGTGYDNGKVTNAYSFATGDSTATKVLTDESVQKAEESYGFDNKNDGTTWKFYDGYSNPLLKVFLTTLTVDSDQVDLVYNAGEQDLNIGELVGNVITAPIVKDGEEIIYNGLDAYYNTVINGSDLGESELLQNTMGQKDAGTYDNWLYSGQIASGSKDGSGFNPNNLGYDIVYTKNDSGETGVEIGKATINIDLGKVEHTYGNADVINGTGNFKNEAGYGFNITNSNLTQEMKDELNDKGLGFVFEKDNALTGDTSGRVTEDVKDGGYTWSANFELSEELKKNYQFDDNGSATLNKADGQSIVNQAKLEISVDDAETMPGVVPNFTGTNIQQGLVNGDVAGNYDYALDSSVDINVDDIYTDKIGISFGNSETYYDLDNVDWSTIPGWEFLKNYDINFDPGTLTVDSEIMPDLPDNWPNNRWDYLFGDNPFDRNENFRERKAEVNFVDGAMEI